MAVSVKIVTRTVDEAIEKITTLQKHLGDNITVYADVWKDETPAVLNAARPSDKYLNNEEATTMVGAIQFANFAGLTSLPQKVASAASAIETSELVGASYEPIFYAGAQPVRGTNYWFLALQTLTTNPIKRRIVKMAVNEFNGKFEIVKDSIKVVFE